MSIQTDLSQWRRAPETWPKVLANPEPIALSVHSPQDPRLKALDCTKPYTPARSPKPKWDLNFGKP